jgi:hypothetical protein
MDAMKLSNINTLKKINDPINITIFLNSVVFTNKQKIKLIKNITPQEKAIKNNIYMEFPFIDR